jgi:hypothetical protein
MGVSYPGRFKFAPPHSNAGVIVNFEKWPPPYTIRIVDLACLDDRRGGGEMVP